jgi:4-diphosphocytidyl-2-C-methyl-D-erythritol kinase
MIVELARAKINLTLRVLGRRADGYHEIESLVAFASVGDVVSLEPGGQAAVLASGRFAAAIDGPNLVSIALRRLGEAYPQLVLGRVTLDKRLPVAAGVGGGSADAAALLRAVARANPDLSRSVDWFRIAAGLGADVPVCHEDRPAIMRGIGERLERVSALPALDAVLVNPMVPVPARKTAMVFEMLAAPALGPERTRDLALVSEALGDRGRLIGLMRRTGNDLMPAAAEVMPEVVVVTTALERTVGVELVQLSGAGPTAYGIYPSRLAAGEAAAKLALDHPGWWVETAQIG